MQTNLPFFTANSTRALGTVIFFNNEKTQNYVEADIVFSEGIFPTMPNTKQVPDLEYTPARNETTGYNLVKNGL